MIICKRAVAAAILAIMAGAPLAAQSGWSNIGRGSLSGAPGRGTIAAHGDPAFRQLMLCTDVHAVRIVDVVITFADNHVQTIHDGERLARGECGRTLEMSAHHQAVTSVDIVFDVASTAGETVQAELYAR